MKVRNELGQFVGSKYKKVNGVWYKGKCQDCGILIKSHTAKRCKPCRGKAARTTSGLGTRLTYSSVHAWLRRGYGNASECENVDCLGKSQTFDWANITGDYDTKDRTHYKMLCRSCHLFLDRGKVEMRFK